MRYDDDNDDDDEQLQRGNCQQTKTVNMTSVMGLTSSRRREQ